MSWSLPSVMASEHHSGNPSRKRLGTYQGRMGRSRLGAPERLRKERGRGGAWVGDVGGRGRRPRAEKGPTDKAGAANHRQFDVTSWVLPSQ